MATSSSDIGKAYAAFQAANLSAQQTAVKTGQSQVITGNAQTGFSSVSASSVSGALGGGGNSGGGASSSPIGSTSNPTNVITSGPYAGMTPVQRQQAVAADIAAQGVAKYGQQGYSDGVAKNAVLAIHQGILDPSNPADAASVAQAFNRAGISQDMAVTSIQKAMAAAPTAPAAPSPAAQVVVTQDDTPLRQVVDIPGNAVQGASNYVSGGFDTVHDLLTGNTGADNSQTTTTQPAPGTKTVGAVSGGTAWILGLVLIAGLVAVLVRKLRRKRS